MLGLLVSTAQAQTATGAQPSAFEMFVPFIFIFVIFYFLIIRPQSKRQKDHQKFLAEVKRGDEIITSSGILGRVEGITDQFVTLEIADGVKIKMLRSQIATSQKAATAEEKK
ncbi:preprotein translocase subunit YajC [Bdellovibrio sp. HCB2-146]|uniref:preprotein translocase subunit YajC n=1 Tax=Bdellovibrio sp. HCB2-146 TaxID=3394362 RepID=UPI0039BCF54C